MTAPETKDRSPCPVCGKVPQGLSLVHVCRSKPDSPHLVWRDGGTGRTVLGSREPER